MENKSFQIDSNIIVDKKRKKKNTNKINNKTSKKPNNKFFIKIFFLLILLIAVFFGIKKHSDFLIKESLFGEIMVCKERLVSKELGYVFNKNEMAFINKKEGLIFSTYFCSSYNK